MFFKDFNFLFQNYLKTLQNYFAYSFPIFFGGTRKTFIFYGAITLFILLSYMDSSYEALFTIQGDAIAYKTFLIGVDNLDPKYGYFPKAGKTCLVVKKER